MSINTKKHLTKRYMPRAAVSPQFERTHSGQDLHCGRLQPSGRASGGFSNWPDRGQYRAVLLAYRT